MHLAFPAGGATVCSYRNPDILGQGTEAGHRVGFSRCNPTTRLYPNTAGYAYNISPPLLIYLLNLMKTLENNFHFLGKFLLLFQIKASHK